MKEYKPLVSIIIPVYNGSNYMKEAIDSALNQTYSNVEIIVVNDGSTDDGATREIALSYGDKIRYIEKENGGVSSALNTGIKAMKGDWFSWLSHDDMYESTKIERQVEILNIKGMTHNDNVVLHCSGKQINAAGEKIICRNTNITHDFTGIEMFIYNRKTISDLNGLAVLIPRHAFDDVGYFDESLIYIQDIKMWYLLMFNDYKFICHNDELVINRVHNKQVSVLKSNINNIERIDFAHEMYDIYFSKDINKYKKCMIYFYYWAIMQNRNEIVEYYKKKLIENNILSIGVKIKSNFYKIKGNVYLFVRGIYKRFIQRRK